MKSLWGANSKRHINRSTGQGLNINRSTEGLDTSQIPFQRRSSSIEAANRLLNLIWFKETSQDVIKISVVDIKAAQL